MGVKGFINDYREAFGERAGLPIAFWYSDEQIQPTEKIPGCFFRVFDAVRSGTTVSLGVETIGCRGGRLYAGFTETPPHVPGLVSGKERYKKTPEMVIDYIERLGMPRMDGKYLNFARIDRIDTFEGKEGLIFIVAPDILSGLAAWAFYDSNREDGVMTVFGSGCSVMVSQTLTENRRGGGRCFFGLFDPSVRPCFAADELGLAIPMSRFVQMRLTMRESCLFDTHAWAKVRERIGSS